MTLTEAENMQNWIYQIPVEEFAKWLEGLREKVYNEGYDDGYAHGSHYD